MHCDEWEHSHEHVGVFYSMPGIRYGWEEKKGARAAPLALRSRVFFLLPGTTLDRNEGTVCSPCWPSRSNSAVDGHLICFPCGIVFLSPCFFLQSSSSSKGKGESKSPITKFFAVKGTAAANGGAGSSSPSSSKKRKLSKSSHEGGGASASAGFVAFCRANRSRVSHV